MTRYVYYKNSKNVQIWCATRNEDDDDDDDRYSLSRTFRLQIFVMSEPLLRSIFKKSSPKMPLSLLSRNRVFFFWVVCYTVSRFVSGIFGTWKLACIYRHIFWVMMSWWGLYTHFWQTYLNNIFGKDQKCKLMYIISANIRECTYIILYICHAYDEFF